MRKPNAEQLSDYLTSMALERQMLGLTKSEYDALTPFEVACELKAVELLRKFKDLRFQILDEHFARLEILANGFKFEDLKRIEDFRLTKREGAESALSDKERKKTEYKFILKDQRCIARFKKRRAELLAKRKAKLNGD